MRMAGRHQHGVFLPGRRIRTQVEVEVEADGVVGAAEEVEVGVATIGEVRHLEGRTIIPTTGRRILG